MTEKTIYKSTEIKIKQQISQEIVFSGFVWSAISSLIVHLIVSYYLIGFRTSPIPYRFEILQLGYLTLSLGSLLFIIGRNKTNQCYYWHIGALMISLSYVAVAFLVTLNWNEIGSSEKILIIGFLVMMMGWHVRGTLIATALVPISVTYLYLSIVTPNTNAFDHVLTMIKFPLLLAAFMFTIRRFFVSTERRFVEKIKLIQELEKSSNIDELTKVSNRKGFNEGLKSAIATSDRFEIPLCLAIIDIDFFKQYNDTLGHPAGDWCLRKVASILQSECKRSVDVVARTGGEEFALILPGATSEQAEQVVQRIKDALVRADIPHPSSSISNLLTISIGIAEYNNENFTSLYERADKAMYEAKVSGRDNCVVADK